MKILMLIIMFLLIGALFIISENNLALRTSENRAKFGKLYYSWFGDIFENTKSVVSYAIKLDWLPGES